MTDKRYNYVVSGYFVTDKPLTEEEIDWLSMRLGMHIDDPEGVEDARHADWTRFDWALSIKATGTAGGSK